MKTAQDFFEFARSMYKDKTGEQVLEHLECLVKKDVFDKRTGHNLLGDVMGRVRESRLRLEKMRAPAESEEDTRFRVGDHVRVNEDIKKYSWPAYCKFIGREFEIRRTWLGSWLGSWLGADGYAEWCELDRSYWPLPASCLDLISRAE